MSTASVVASALRDHLPDLRERQLHALLYLAQGFHLAANDRALFDELIVPTETGVTVSVHTTKGQPLDEAGQATVGVVAARYGRLSSTDLEALVRGQQPWRDARTREADVIDLAGLTRCFRDADEDPDGTASGIPRHARSRSGLRSSAAGSSADDPVEIAEFAAELRARM